MNKLLRYKDYLGTVEYSLNDKVFFGEVLWIDSLLSYQGNTIEELEEDFNGTIVHYLELCIRKNWEPEKTSVVVVN
ncbi:DNA repair protein [Ligilactobacillus salivarius]|uniref:DNA repair protein n=1 Tax=Ligilactobacillus salivarius TaxID=1624 RepID=UPI0024B9664C|nr:DNA repair protein [Ligilactobacillus salivarius]WHS11266.1 DNA repair protein [Ligilactobacillus salivarius]